MSELTVLVSGPDRLFGVGVAAVEQAGPTAVRGTMPADDRFLGPDGRFAVGALGVLVGRHMLHGGISLAASEVVATWSRLDAGSSLTTSSLHIAHLRGIPAGATVEFTASTRHAGRSLWLTEVEGRVAGRLCTSTRVTAEATPV